MKTNSILLFLLMHLNVFSQEKNYKITYRHCLQYDTLKFLTDTIGREAILVGNSNESNYSFAKKPVGTIPIQNKNVKTFDDVITSKTSGSGTLSMPGALFDSIGNMVQYNRKTNLISVREKMIKEYVLTEEKMSSLNWKITGDTRRIQNYECIKANAHFRGRDYTAWFTTDVAIVAAPWKFFGLPGLVMDIEDSRHQVKIYVEKIEYPVPETVPPFVALGTKIDIEIYFDFRNEEFKKQLKMMEAMMMQQDHMQEITAQTGKAPKATSKSALYNIELRSDR